jgi:hypothetical protein
MTHTFPQGIEASILSSNVLIPTDSSKNVRIISHWGRGSSWRKKGKMRRIYFGPFPFMPLGFFKVTQ